MQVQVKGVVIETIAKKNDEGVESYTIRLFQSGERELVDVKSQVNGLSVGDFVTVKGRLFPFKTREGVRVIVMADEIS